MSLWEKFFGKKEEPEQQQAPIELSEKGQQALNEAQKLFDEGKYGDAVNLMVGAANEDKDLLRTELMQKLVEQANVDDDTKSRVQQASMPAYRWNPDK